MKQLWKQVKPSLGSTFSNLAEKLTSGLSPHRPSHTNLFRQLPPHIIMAPVAKPEEEFNKIDDASLKQRLTVLSQEKGGLQEFFNKAASNPTFFEEARKAAIKEKLILEAIRVKQPAASHVEEQSGREQASKQKAK